jgi:hypothetical protein
VAGVTAPQYGMPYCGTPIGLPGPPHVPLGVPAGLQSHVIANHTCVDLPDPVKHMRVDVKQCPGISYPKPVNQVCIKEETTMGLGVFRQPCADKHQVIRPGAACQGGVCPTGYEAAGDPGAYDPSAGAPAGTVLPGNGGADTSGPACTTGTPAAK